MRIWSPKGLLLALCIILAVDLVVWQVIRSVSKKGARGKSSLLLDEAAVFDKQQTKRIQVYLRYVRNHLGIDTRVVVVKTFDEDVVDWTADRFSKLGVGEDFQGMGLLLMVALKPPTARVEVGYTLEPYITDIEASTIVSDYLKTYFQSNELGAAVEVAIEMMVNQVKEKMADLKTSKSNPIGIHGSGGGGSTADLLADIPEVLDKEGREKIKKIMVPQETPEQAYDLELAMLKKGIFLYDLPFYDEHWRTKEPRRTFSPQALKRSAATFNKPYRTYIEGNHAIIYYPEHRDAMPSLLDRTEDGWIINRTLTARMIHYNLDSSDWFAYKGDYPHLKLFLKVLKMKSVKLVGGQKAYQTKD